MPTAQKRRLLYILFTANAFAMMAFFWYTSAHSFFGTGGGAVIGLGNIAGILGAYLLLVQLVLIARIRFLEDAWGMERLLELHHTNGQWGLLLIFVHPILLTIGYQLTVHTSFLPQLIDFIFNYTDMKKAALGTVMLLVVVALSITIARRRLKYETWYAVHLLAYLAILLAFFHQVTTGPDFIVNKYYQVYWYALYVAAAGIIIGFRFWQPLWLWWRYRFRVERVVPETNDTFSIYIGGRGLKGLKYRPGQFVIWRFLAKNIWWQAHPFTISWGPGHESLRLTFKALGDFTGALRSVKPGTPVVADGPHGQFIPDSRQSKVLLIAGGIGVTPIRAMLGALAGRDAVLLYACRSERDIALRAEIERLAVERRVKLHYLFSDLPSPLGRTGYVDAAALKELVPDAAERAVWLCGPPVMMNAVTQALTSVGVPTGQIRTERFAY